MIGRKIYYELATGNVIMSIPQKNNENTINTSKEQDFLMFEVLQARNPELVGVKQMNYGELQGDFELANTYKIDIKTNEVLFQYPIYQVPQLGLIEILKTEMELQNENINNLGKIIAQEKIKNMQKDTVISNLGQELANAKINIIKLQGGI